MFPWAPVQMGSEGCRGLVGLDPQGQGGLEPLPARKGPVEWAQGPGQGRRK
jgi:hypothetical protein